jgi:tetratricopeptide (TPR) repeat protein
MRSYIFASTLLAFILITPASGQDALASLDKIRDLMKTDYQLALAEANKAIALAGPREMFLDKMYERRAEILTRLGRHREAAEDYSKLITLSETNRLYWYGSRAEAYCNSGKYAEALADYSATLPWKEWDAQSRGYIIAKRARCHLKNGHKDLAAADIELAIATSKDGLAYNLRGHQRMAEGKLELANEDFAQAVANDSSIEFERDRSNVNIKMGKAQMIYDYIDETVKNHRDHGNARYRVHRGELALVLKRYADAVKDASDVLGGYLPDDAEDRRRSKTEALTVRAAAFCAMGKKAEAAADEAELIKLGAKVAKPCSPKR